MKLFVPVSAHEAPFLHGRGRQSSTSCLQSLPFQPFEQRQVYLLGPASLHDACLSSLVHGAGWQSLMSVHVELQLEEAVTHATVPE